MKAGGDVYDAGHMGIVGTGRMAKALGALLRGRGFHIAAIAGRGLEAAAETALFTGADEAVSVVELPQYARQILVAVPDDAICGVGCELAKGGLEGGIVLHTSGAAGPEALARLRGGDNAVGVLHPLQTVPDPNRGLQALPGATFAYAGDTIAAEWARSLIQQLGGRALAIDPQRWQTYHAAAVMACNYHITLVDAALELMESAGIDRNPALDALAPLIRTTTENVLSSGPERALTGPIARGDAGSIRRHGAALRDSPPDTRRLYAAAGLRTIALAQRSGLSAEAAREITAALEDCYA
jgi:predicted short-subunit dehydrogenase-like oxidoreductase (DUF2520 family)